MRKHSIVALLLACSFFAACGTDAADPGTPEPVATEGDDAGGGTMDDQDLDY